MARTLARTGLIALTLLALAAPAHAQVVQSVGVGVGGFLPRGLDSRSAGDVLVADLTDVNPLFFRVGDFTSGHVAGEWNVGFGKHIEFGAGIGFYQRQVPSVYRDLVDQNTGRDIAQDLRLRIIPFTAVVRFLPFGGPSKVQPYVGVGISALSFRYSEVGDFVDPSDNAIFPGRFVATGVAPGAVVLVGVRVPIKGDIYAFTFESRYQFGSGKTGGVDAGFLNDKIDLSGNNVTLGFLIRF